MALRRVNLRCLTPAGCLAPIVFISILLLTTPPAHADIIRGVGKIISGVLAIPMSTLAGTFNGPPIIGTLAGAISGAFNGVGSVLSGVLDVASSAIPLAKAVAPFLIPVFL